VVLLWGLLFPSIFVVAYALTQVRSALLRQGRALTSSSIMSVLQNMKPRGQRIVPLQLRSV
jgi:hypothetical protein